MHLLVLLVVTHGCSRVFVCGQEASGCRGRGVFLLQRQVSYSKNEWFSLQAADRPSICFNVIRLEIVSGGATWQR